MNELYSSHNTEPLVSFIITSYNIPSHMIKECIGSLLKLSLSNEEREIILVDDGSDISVINEITELRDELVYVRQRNKGLSVARNTGLRYASGRYIQFVDGDDFIIPAPYEHCLDIARYQTPDMIMFKMTSTTDVGVPFSYSEPVSGSNYMKNNNLVASVCGFLFRRNILGDLRFRPGIVHEDEDFTPQLLLRAENVISTNASAYYYRKRNNSITNNKDKSHIYNRLSDFKNVILHLQSIIETIPETDRPALQRRIAQLTMDYIYNIIRLTHDREYLDNAIRQMKEHMLFPLPDKNYTKKYVCFRKVVNNRLLRNLLFTMTTK